MDPAAHQPDPGRLAAGEAQWLAGFPGFWSVRPAASSWQGPQRSLTLDDYARAGGCCSLNPADWSWLVARRGGGAPAQHENA
jgi:hypothetical protein